ncbi:RagB/SusD family nutrient uptake outer membrane protein [Mucilaginibacter antarcticus]
MVSVLKKCIADLKTAKNDLPLMISDPTNRSVRASKAAIIALLMNMNMWNAGFDAAGKTGYYQETEALGAELMTQADIFKSPRLYTLSEWALVTKGRSEEGLFELFNSANYGSAIPFNLAPIGEAFTHFPYKLPEYDNRSSPAVFTAEYMKKLYPELNDLRLSIWFEDAFNQNAETFQLKKFANNSPIDGSAGAVNGLPDNTFLIFRYADVILLRAEALAELNINDRATDMLNKIRRRAVTADFPNPNGEPYSLKDAIFYERAKELMGEGTHYFDLVRTKRITSRNYTENPLTSDKFARGGWTWPIDGSALSNNPLMTLNAYWIGSGLE